LPRGQVEPFGTGYLCVKRAILGCAIAKMTLLVGNGAVFTNVAPVLISGAIENTSDGSRWEGSGIYLRGGDVAVKLSIPTSVSN
jgi:hypothetical protein